MNKNKNDNTKKLDSPYYFSSNNDKSNRKNSSRSVLITKEIFEHGPDKKIPFTLIRSKRRKTSELIIEDEKEITLRVPFDKPMEEIKEIIQRKIQWIFKKQEEYKRNKSEIKVYSYLPHSSLPYLGNNYEIEIRDVYASNNIVEKVDIENNKLIFYLKDISTEANQNNQSGLHRIADNEIMKNKIKILYERLLIEHAQIIFKEKINEFSKIIGVTPNYLRIKKLKNRWGSVTKKDILNLNINLLKAPETIVDYVITHELCHLKIQGHSHDFWRFLKLFEPDYEKKIKWLEINGKNILIL
ncbi:MAG: SprT family zinc-dependent metalloprotease [Nitrososphaeraceae archaeon]